MRVLVCYREILPLMYVVYGFTRDPVVSSIHWCGLIKPHSFNISWAMLGEREGFECAVRGILPWSISQTWGRAAPN